jgi:dienelactone hydrolase
VSDIFGRTPALDNFCKAVGSDVDVIDPYAGKYMRFQTEQQAYECFMANMGLNAYCDLLQSRLEKAPTPTGLIGFSVGAAAIWQISESLNTEKVKRVVCFYGSQVRLLAEIKPSVVVEHVLPMQIIARILFSLMSVERNYSIKVIQKVQSVCLMRKSMKTALKNILWIPCLWSIAPVRTAMPPKKRRFAWPNLEGQSKR